MSLRKALPIDTELRFGPDTCFSLKNEVGRGGSCIVYDAIYRTNAGDDKIVRIRECYPFDIQLKRDEEGALICSESDSGKFASAKTQMYEDFRLCNRLFCSGDLSDAITNTINIYEANNTVYVVSAWSRENVLTSIKPDSLRRLVSIVRQTAEAIDSIHKAGYLYLDIKPDNISVVSGRHERVQLFDFDSLVPIDSLKEAHPVNQRLSYTRGFAALELRRGQLSGISPKTDVFGIGALLFYMLFGRTPEAPDCTRNAEYDFSGVKYEGPFPDRLLILLTDFFRKTLASFPMDRYASMDPVIEILSEAERIADPVYPFLVSTPLNPPSYFIGRKRETEMLEAWYRDGSQQRLFVSGMGGIGKSTFIRHFLTEHHREWDSIAILYFRNSIRETLIDDSALKINGMERFPEEKEADYFDRKLKKLRGIMERDRVLLVIDNFENRHDPDLDKIFALNCRTIFISRTSLGTLNLPVLNLGTLADENDLLELFIHYLDRTIEEEEKNVIRKIIRQLGGHTLALELISRQISSSFITPQEALILLEKYGALHAGSERVDYLRDNHISYESLEAIITKLFETDRLSQEQVSFLKALTLFPAPGINIREFKRLACIDYTEPVQCLVRYGWITQTSADKRIFLHPLIRDVIRDISGSDTALIFAQNVLQTLYKDITAESHKEEINISDPGNFPEEVRGIPFDEILTDYQKLNTHTAAARGVIDALSKDLQMAGCPAAQKLHQAMVINLPKHEDEAILNYGLELLEHPEHLTALEILELFEPVEKALLARQDYDAAFRLIEEAEKYAVDERTKAEFCGLVSNIYDFRGEPEDHEEMLAWLEAGIDHARLAPPPKRKHLLAEFLLGKLNAFTRSMIEDETGIWGLISELVEIIEKECLPYSEIRCGFAVAMGFFWAEIGQNHAEVDQWVSTARSIGERLYPAGLDFIDNNIIPPAIMYLDLKDYDESETWLIEGIQICDEHPDMIAYQRKKHDLYHCLLDVYLEAEKYSEARGILKIIDEGICHGFPDSVQSEVREFFEN